MSSPVLNRSTTSAIRASFSHSLTCQSSAPRGGSSFCRTLLARALTAVSLGIKNHMNDVQALLKDVLPTKGMRRIAVLTTSLVPASFALPVTLQSLGANLDTQQILLLKILTPTALTILGLFVLLILLVLHCRSLRISSHKQTAFGLKWDHYNSPLCPTCDHPIGAERAAENAQALGRPLPFSPKPQLYCAKCKERISLTDDNGIEMSLKEAKLKLFPLENRA